MPCSCSINVASSRCKNDDDDKVNIDHFIIVSLRPAFVASSKLLMACAAASGDFEDMVGERLKGYIERETGYNDGKNAETAGYGYKGTANKCPLNGNAVATLSNVVKIVNIHKS